MTTADRLVTSVGLSTIAKLVRGWLDWHKEHRDREHLITEGDTTIMALPVPMWPSHDQFEHWIDALDRGASLLAADTSPASGGEFATIDIGRIATAISLFAFKIKEHGLWTDEHERANKEAFDAVARIAASPAPAVTEEMDLENRDERP